ncbi:hypothetical protein B0O99DRAFT_689518 [Bisporella sp. PMI_857]|nr:hypothetical protein B0O99DRAFT_689518 [Bisporella sp. PMI_857]
MGTPIHPLDVSCRAAAATSSSSTQESEEMPIHRYFTLKTVAPKGVYCLTFSLELLPLSQYQGQKQARPATLRGKRKRVPWTPEENKIREMKKEGCSWEDIHHALPDRTLSAVQAQHSTKLESSIAEVAVPIAQHPH